MWDGFSLSSVSDSVSSAFTHVASLIEGDASAAADKPRVLLPWENPRIPDAKRAEVEMQVRNLGVHRRTFMDPPPPSVTTAEFVLDEARIAQALRLLEVDKELARWRWDIVPGKISEERFWRNYFARVELVTDAATSIDAVAVPSGEEKKTKETDNDNGAESDEEEKIEKEPVAVVVAAATRLPDRRHSDMGGIEVLDQEQFATDETVY